MKSGLSNGWCVICSFLALALTGVISDNIGPQVVAFAAEVRQGVTFEVFGFSFYVQEETLLVRATMYYGLYTIFLGGMLTVCLWHMRWWTVAVTVMCGTVAIAMGVLNNELSYAIAHNAPRYPDSFYWTLALYYAAPVATCVTVWAEVEGHKERMKSVSPASPA